MTPFVDRSTSWHTLRVSLRSRKVIPNSKTSYIPIVHDSDFVFNVRRFKADMFSPSQIEIEIKKGR